MFTYYEMLREKNDEGQMRRAVKKYNKVTIRAEKCAVTNCKQSKTGSQQEKGKMKQSSVHNNVHSTQVCI